jgi:hypothetical protein
MSKWALVIGLLSAGACGSGARQAPVVDGSMTAAAGDAAGDASTAGDTSTASDASDGTANTDGGSASAEVAPSPDATATVTPVRTVDLLAQALAAGEITADDALVYEVLSTFGDSRLPSKYAGTVVGVKEHDLLLPLLAEHFDALTPAQQDLIAGYFIPPAYASDSGNGPAMSALPSADPGADTLRAPERPGPCSRAAARLSAWSNVSSDHFVVWYDSVGRPDLVPLLQPVLLAADETYTALIERPREFRAPLDDSTDPCNGGDGKLDIYLDSRLDPAPNVTNPTIAQTVTVRLGEGPTPVFILLAPTVLLRGFDPVSGTLSVARKASIAHEIMHAIQHAYNNQWLSTYLWTRDATATWATGVVYPHNSDEQNYAKELMARMSTPLFFPNAYCNTTTECGNDHVADQKMYGAYLFFQYASLNAIIGYEFVRGFFESGEKMGDPLAALDDALNKAGEKGIASVWPGFVLALWNQPPIPDNATFASLDMLTETYSAALRDAFRDVLDDPRRTLPVDSDVQTVDLMTTADPMDPTKGLTKDLTAPSVGWDDRVRTTPSADRRFVFLDELSATYDRYKFGDNARTLVFYNGFSQKLSTIPMSLVASIGPDNHQVALDDGEIYAAYVPDAAEVQGRHVTALEKIKGVWKLEDWTEKQIVTFCQDRADQHLDELVIIYSNAGFTSSRQSSFDAGAAAPIGPQPARLVAAQTPCWKYQGSATADLTYEDINDNFTISTTFTGTFVGKPRDAYTTTDQGDAYLLGGWLFAADPTTVQYDGRIFGQVRSCPYGSFDFPLSMDPADAAAVQFDVAMPINRAGAVYNAYRGIGSSVAYQLPCTNGVTKELPATDSFNFTSRLTQATLPTINPDDMTLVGTNFMAPVRSLGSYTPPAPVPDATYNWCFAPLREVGPGAGMPPTACP